MFFQCPFQAFDDRAFREQIRIVLFEIPSVYVKKDVGVELRHIAGKDLLHVEIEGGRTKGPVIVLLCEEFGEVCVLVIFDSSAGNSQTQEVRDGQLPVVSEKIRSLFVQEGTLFKKQLIDSLLGRFKGSCLCHGTTLPALF